MLKPVLDCALDAFIRGLPDDMSIFVNTRNPRDVSDAMEYALHIEERLDYTEHETSHKHEKKVSHENSKMITFEQNSTHPSSTVPKSTPYPRFPHPFYGNMPTIMGGHPSYLGPQLPYPLYGMPYPYAALNSFHIGKPSQNLDWKNQGRPFLRPNSSGPAKDLNSKLTPGQDATPSLHSSERPNSNKFLENTVGSFKQGGTPKTPQWWRFWIQTFEIATPVFS